MTHRHPLDQEHTITWTTNYKGTTYVLDHHGRLQPITEQEHAWQQHDYPEPTTTSSASRSYIESSEMNSTQSPND